MAFGTIYSYPNNPRVIKTHAAANLNGLEVTEAPFQMGVTNRTPEFLTKFPLGKIPAFESADSSVRIFESDAITQYVAESGPAASQLLGSTPAEKAQIRQWIVFAEGEVMGAVTRSALWRVGLKAYDEATETAALASLDRAVKTLETHLQGRTWLASEEKLSLADISVASALVWAFSMILDAELRPQYPTVLAWYDRVLETEGVKQAFGEKKFIEKRKAPPS
ncbi:glutathione S-transferase family protein [Aspergillus ruber CBS 135680]|uniref:Translation elongation factor eEF-1B gamma subunit n=1 Tax=Aspergillus ruber (strain CBS 135680) TaxID=1388766 RepID=A0A017SP99_ASPRC|nr:translation elongation factor eEF-1B gamma subunit [Aspergillus ruber CBS 135680]EYE98797.1 translation elongation factor eEF-1B gamma subunit [Aspergillus ruber CBS 135680]